MYPQDQPGARLALASATGEVADADGALVVGALAGWVAEAQANGTARARHGNQRR
ncbi:MAG: hypothetical protein ACHREM_03690 [Polyangiales bacterium]